MKVLVTGANGLLGVNLIRELVKSGVDVKGFVRPTANLKVLEDLPCEIRRGSILSFEDIHDALQDCDAVIHAASTTSVMPREFEFYRKVNVDSTKNVVNAVLRQGNKRMVHVSTAHAFGPGSKENPGTELSPFTLGRYKSGYINSKYMAQQYVLQHVATHQLDAVVVNPNFIIGPYDAKPSSGKIILLGLGRGVQWCPPGGKNFVHACDVARGILLCFEGWKERAMLFDWRRESNIPRFLFRTQSYHGPKAKAHRAAQMDCTRRWDNSRNAGPSQS